MPEKRLGRQTPTVRFTLPYTETRGPDAIEIYHRSGRTAQEWQSGLIYDMLATEDDLWVHSRFGYSVPRQNGKNEVIAIREMYGLFNGERILHTAHRTATSRAAWERLVMLCENAGVREIKGEVTSGYKSGKSKGQEWIEFDDEHGGGRVSFRTRSTTGGLGETYDCLVIDEAQEYQDDQESALKYTIVSSDNPQTIYLGTPPTLYSSGTIFPNLRRDILCGDKKHAGWAEWSVDMMTDVHDVDAWYETNPNLGYKLSERAIEDEIGDDSKKTDFNIQRLGLWLTYNQKSAISKTEWDALSVPTLPKLSGLLSIGVKFNKDGSTVSLSIAVKAEDSIFIECVGCHSMRDGLDWITQFLNQVNGQYTKVIIDGANGTELLQKQMKEYRLKQPHIPTSKEFIDANALFEQLLFSKSIIHMEQPGVTNIVTNSEKRAIGSAGGFGYKPITVTGDISIMDSLILAVWGLKTFERRKSKISY